LTSAPTFTLTVKPSPFMCTVSNPMCVSTAHPPREIHGRVVLGQDVPGDGVDTHFAGTSREPAQQQRAHPAPLPGIGDHEGHFRGVRMCRVADEPGDADDGPARSWRHGDQCLVVVVVDVGQVTDHLWASRHECGSI
jgi:hypothetical protein